jgi:hypothetical protein
MSTYMDPLTRGEFLKPLKHLSLSPGTGYQSPGEQDPGDP